MAEKIKYYIDEKNRSVTAVINDPDTDAHRNIKNVIHNRVSTDAYSTIMNLCLYRRYIGKVYKLSSTVTAEPEAEFNEDTIERLKYIAKCSVKNKYHKRIQKIYQTYLNVMNRMYTEVNNRLLKKNNYILNTHPFKYIDPEDWDEVKKNRAKNKLDEI